MNSAIGYSEGAEVPEDKTYKRIEKSIKRAAYKSHPLGFKDSVSVDWAVEAILEERHRAIDECIHILQNNPGDMNIIPLLESLKNKPI